MKLKGKIALVLGGVGSIGSAISDVLEEEGAIVCRHGLIGDYSGDVADFQASERMVNPILGKYGAVDILVNSVSAPAKLASFDKKTWQDFLAHFTVQLKSAVEVTQMVLPKMKERKWGRIVNIASSYTRGVPPGSLTDYVTSKYAIIGLTKALAAEVGRYGITANAISPSFIKNKFTENVPSKVVEMLIEKSSEKRLINPEDVASKVLEIILSDLNGENVFITAGTEN